MIKHAFAYNHPSVNYLDELSLKLSSSRKWGMGAFIAVFDPSLEKVLMVKTGLYAKNAFGGTPWNLPGGAVEPGELPSDAAIRELREETGLSSPSNLIIAAWLERPYYKSRNRESPGELILLFAGIDKTCGFGLRPAPPEIISCGFYYFDMDEWLKVPATGNMGHILAPLPRHWIYWTLMSQIMLKNQESPIFTHEYLNPSLMDVIPDVLRSRLENPG